MSPIHQTSNIFYKYFQVEKWNAFYISEKVNVTEHQAVSRKQKPVGKSLCVSSISAAEERRKKRKTKYDRIINSIPTLWIPSYGYHSACYRSLTAISKPKIKAKTSTRSTKISTRSENTSPLLPYATGVLTPICIFCNKGKKKLEVDGKNLQKMKNMKLK